jgi:nitroimidazol reductase NimA-like FMN-containing flavoprotein (pyridoxamine 5'-phosphate oxidase superfamily)
MEGRRVKEPSLPEVSEAVAQLLREEEIATLATIDDDGCPSAATMHSAADGFSVYMHTFTYNRKYSEMLKDPRVSYAVAHLGSYEERFLVYSLQVKGRATLLTDPGEIARAVQVSMEQFPWLADTSMYDNVQTPEDHSQQVFFRIDPVSALWTDNRVRLLWRMILDFASDASSITAMRPYDLVVGRRTA